MCNLYSAIDPSSLAASFGLQSRQVGNLASLPAIFPDTLAPVIIAGKEGLEREIMRWGFPAPQSASAVRPVTNVRNTASPFWKPWLATAQRCIVPATSFCEWTDNAPKVPHWFALDESRPYFAFAGIWRTWEGVRKGEAAVHHLFAFLTCKANSDVAPIHAKAMPVILRGKAEFETWLYAPAKDALTLQRPLPEGLLKVVAKGEKQDPPLSRLL